MAKFNCVLCRQSKEAKTMFHCFVVDGKLKIEATMEQKTIGSHLCLDCGKVILGYFFDCMEKCLPPIGPAL